MVSVKASDLKFGDIPKLRDAADKWPGHEDIAEALKENSDVWAMVETGVSTGKAVRIAKLIKEGKAPGFAIDATGHFEASTRKNPNATDPAGKKDGFNVFACYKYTGPDKNAKA